MEKHTHIFLCLFLSCITTSCGKKAKKLDTKEAQPMTTHNQESSELRFEIITPATDDHAAKPKVGQTVTVH